ncbi:MAG: AAA family ATPase [Opitutales bacterium]|nr:AAA family ATPase [Opitutales bacterium]
MTSEYVAKLFRDKYGASCIPVTAEKAPLVKWSLYRDRRPTDAEISRWFSGDNSIAVVAGKVQCIDFDEKYSPNIFGRFCKRCEENMVEIAKLGLLCQRTPSGGFHLVFLCEPDERNQKLAATESGNVAIETRASGGYFLIAPSKGYEIISGNIENIPAITVDERDELFSIARSFNCSHKEKRLYDASFEKPGDDYDQNADIPELLRGYGWTHAGGEYWRRPGKSRGISATWNHIPNRFFVFSSSTQFEPNVAYKPWHVYAVLKCGGDFRKAAKELSQMGYGLHDRTISATYSEISAKLGQIAKKDGLTAGDGGHVKLPPILKYTEAVKKPECNVIPDEVVCGVLHRGCKLILSAPSKTGKSWTMLELGLSVAGGRHWMGIETVPTPVLYIDFEFLYGLFSERRNKIIAAKYGDADIDLPFYELVLRGYDASFFGIKSHIENFCKEKEIGLIIVDPIYKLADDFDENKARDVAKLLREFERLASELNAAIAFAHHFAKGNSSEKGSIDRASGSGVWAREPDAILMLTPLDEENYALEMHLRNFPQKAPVAVYWNGGIWEVNPNIDIDSETEARRKKYASPGRPKTGATMRDLKSELLRRNCESVSRSNVEEIAKKLNVSARTVYRLWKDIRSAAKNKIGEDF